MSVLKILYLIENQQTETASYIREFHRNRDGTCEMKVIRDYKPFFYVDEEAPVDKLEGVVKTEPGYTSIDNTPLKKVLVQKSSQVRPLREKMEEMGFRHWEADILFHNRYTATLPEEIEGGPLKVCWLDIETASNIEGDYSFPNMETANQTICAITTKIGTTTISWLCGPKTVNGVRHFEKEEEMLEDFMSWFAKEAPDIISAWNLDFDLHYLIKRCGRLNIDYKRISKTREVWSRNFKGRTYYKTSGTVQLDLLEAYKLWRKYGNLPILASYSLDYVAKTVINDKKVELDRPIGWLWHNRPDKLIEYNRHDVELLDKIDNVCKIIRFFDELRRKCRVQFEDVYKTTALIDGFLISRLKGKVILPTARHNPTDKFTGAYVFEPVPGLYKNVLCEDIASMYPVSYTHLTLPTN